MSRLLPLFWVVACEREPDLHGYWDIAELRVGASREDASAESLAGSLEFTREDEAFAVYSYTWTGTLAPDPSPDVVAYTWSMVSSEPDDFSYVGEGETFALHLWHTGGVLDAFSILDWRGSSVTLRSTAASPPPAGYDTPQMFVELTLER